jgi:hypothetical protein
MMEETTTIKRSREETKMNITTVGLDLAKNVFHVICVNAHGKEVKKRMLRRRQGSSVLRSAPSMLCCHGGLWRISLLGKRITCTGA